MSEGGVSSARRCGDLPVGRGHVRFSQAELLREGLFRAEKKEWIKGGREVSNLETRGCFGAFGRTARTLSSCERRRNMSRTARVHQRVYPKTCGCTGGCTCSTGVDRSEPTHSRGTKTHDHHTPIPIITQLQTNQS